MSTDQFNLAIFGFFVLIASILSAAILIRSSINSNVINKYAHIESKADESHVYHYVLYSNDGGKTWVNLDENISLFINNK